MPMCKVLHIITGLQTGGAERSLHSLLAGDMSDRLDCHVISLSDTGTFGPKITDLGVPVSALGMRGGKPSAAALFSMRRLVKRIRPDVVQGWMYHGNFAALLARKFAPGNPALAWNIRQTLYGLELEKRLTRGMIRLGAKQSKRPGCIIYNSHMSRSQHENFGYSAHQGLVIPNGFDTALWRPDAQLRADLRNELGIKEKDRVIGFVGRYHPMKDIPNFLQAVGQAMASDTGLHIVLVGRDSGPENTDLASYYAALPMDRVHFLGQREDIPSILPCFDVLCLSSAWGDAFPNVIGEAMAAGVPCVATDVGDSARIVADTGQIVAARDPGKLADALRVMLRMPDADRRDLGLRARNRIETKYSLTNTTKAYTELYVNLSER